jgi:MFS family permease
VLLGISAGQAVLAYTSQVYVLFFLQRTLKVPTDTTYVVMAVALFFVAPVFLAVAALSDRVGRKRLMMAGNLLGALIFYPVYRGLAHFADPLNTPMLAFLLFVQMLPIAIVFGPFAAYTVETFPARIRYTSVSVPYHIGNGWFGGFLPLIASAIVARTQNTFSWLLYPIAVLVMSVIVGSLFIDESFKNRIWREVEQQQTPA